MSANSDIPRNPTNLNEKIKYQRYYNNWHSSLQPCEISESELENIKLHLAVNKQLCAFRDSPIDVTDIISDNNGVISFKEPKQVEEIEAVAGKQHIYDWEWYQPLFDLMLTHNVKLLEGEMDEIIDCVNKMNSANRNI